jgi:hypothetical protein
MVQGVGNCKRDRVQVQGKVEVEGIRGKDLHLL